MPGPDVFDQLLAVKWRGVEFPVTKHRLSIAHDLVEHKEYGVDGARVESTGLAPMRFSFSAPLLNGISPGKNERWAALYPNQFRALIAAFQKKEAGLLDHLEFGPILCKAERMDIDWEASRRGGVDVELSFVETKIADEETSILQSRTQIEVVDIGAVELDSARRKRDLKALLEAAGVALPPYLAKKTISLSDLANKIKAVADYPSVVSYRAAGQIDSLLYQANRIQASVEKAKSAVTWPVTQNVERMRAAAHGLREGLLEGEKPIRFYVVPQTTTIAGLIQQIPRAKIGDLVKLNPGLMSKPQVPKDTVVRYIARAAE
jgi:hypothetical protein